jgi:hypothetical protein
MGIKLMYSLLNQCYNDIVKLIIDLILAKHNMPKDLYQSKKIIAGLGMNYEKIDVCERNCMLFWKENKNDTECMHCGKSRYVKVINKDGASVPTKVAVKQLCYMPITLRLKWLYLSKETAKQMRWHKEGKHDSEDPDIMSHHANSESWEALDRFNPEFARDPRSVRLGLSMDGFQPHSEVSSPYSCWPVFIPPYNLPPNKCLKQGFVFLTLVILGPKELKKQMNVFLRLLMEKMKEMWKKVDAYDSHLKCRFNLRAVYLWLIHDYLAYGKFVSWCVHGRLNCLICMDDTDALRLQHSNKVTFFDCHRRFLPSNHLFKNDTRLFLKGKTIRKGLPKRKFGADIIKMLDDLKESENGVFEGYGENNN